MGIGQPAGEVLKVLVVSYRRWCESCTVDGVGVGEEDGGYVWNLILRCLTSPHAALTYSRKKKNCGREKGCWKEMVCDRLKSRAAVGNCQIKGESERERAVRFGSERDIGRNFSRDRAVLAISNLEETL